MTIISNPIMVSVAVMLILCVLKVNVLISVITASMLCAVIGGAGLLEGMNTFVAGLNGNIEVVLSMLLFGIVANAMVKSGIGEALSPRLTKLMGKNAWVLIILLGVMAIISETFILIAAIFVPIVVPPLLSILNQYKIDRRLAAVSIISGFQIGYACIPVGYGLIFQGIIRDEMAANGLDIPLSQVTKACLPILLAMIIAVIVAMILFRKPREYSSSSAVEQARENELPKIEWKHIACILSALVGVVIQVATGSMGLGAFSAVVAMFFSGAVKPKDFDKVTVEGTGMMAFVCFVLMAASGFANVGRTYGQVDALVSAFVDISGTGKLIPSIVMLFLGLVITMGIGSSWGTAPIIAAVFVPMGQELGFSATAIALMIASASVLGDAGSPSSDQTLIPTASFNIDGQHDHIYDTCIPSFLCDNVALFVVTILAVYML